MKLKDFDFRLWHKPNLVGKKQNQLLKNGLIGFVNNARILKDKECLTF